MTTPAQSVTAFLIHTLMRPSKILVFCSAIAFNLILGEDIFAQGRVILNGATINLSQGACLVLDNAASDALTRSSA